MAPAFPSSLCLMETSGALCKDLSHVSLDTWNVVTGKIIQSSGAGLGMELGTVTFTATIAATQQRLYCIFVHNIAPQEPPQSAHRGLCEAEWSPPS